MKDAKTKKQGRVKSFLTGLANKLDKKLEEKAKNKKCCCRDK